MGARRKLTMAQLGTIIIFAGLVSPMLTNLVKPPQNRAEMLGSGMAGVVMLVIGIVVFIIGKRRGG